MIALFFLLVGCPDPAQTDTEPDSEAGTDAVFSVECDPFQAELGITTPSGECVVGESSANGIGRLSVRADCTDPAIQGHLDKRHVVLTPPEAIRDALWLHLPGTGGQPTNTTNILEAAASSGYRAIGLAYLNEPSSAARCFCPEGPRPLECEERVRVEDLYGVDVTDWYDLPSEESISYRLVALLNTLHDRQPSDGWDEYLTDDDEPDWSRIAVSGFSQGGGMAGLIARDHEVERAVYFSLGSGSAPGFALDPDSITSCDSELDCDEGSRCCHWQDPWALCEPHGDGDDICVDQQPSALANTGQDIDGDYLGEGTADTRATPGTRQFALVHVDESAWEYSPEVFAGWGMGSRADYVDADTLVAPIASTARLFSTALPPRNSCSEHQSIGANPCQPVDGSGVPRMRPVWIHAMTTDVP